MVLVVGVLGYAMVRGRVVAGAPERECRWESRVPEGSAFWFDGVSLWPPGFGCKAETPSGEVVSGYFR